MSAILDQLDDAVAKNQAKAENDADFRHYYHAAMNRAYRLGQMNNLCKRAIVELQKHDKDMAEQYLREFLRQSA